MDCWDHAHVVAISHGQTPSVMRRRAIFHRDNARLLVRQLWNRPGARNRPVEDKDAIAPDATNLKTVFGKINRQYANL